MNARAERRLEAIEAERNELLKRAEDLRLEPRERLQIAQQLIKLLKETEALKDGAHWLRGNTTAENKDLYEIVQREIGSNGKVMKHES